MKDGVGEPTSVLGWVVFCLLCTLSVRGIMQRDQKQMLWPLGFKE